MQHWWVRAWVRGQISGLLLERSLHPYIEASAHWRTKVFYL